MPRIARAAESTAPVGLILVGVAVGSGLDTDEEKEDPDRDCINNDSPGQSRAACGPRDVFRVNQGWALTDR